MRAKDLLDRKIIKIYEGLNQQIKENNESVDDVNTKLDIIMDALGLSLEDNKTEENSADESNKDDKQPSNNEDEIEKPVDLNNKPDDDDIDKILNNDEDIKNSAEDIEKVTEGLEYKKAKYEIIYTQDNEFNIYDSDKDLVSGQGVNKIMFDDFDNLVEYLNKRKDSVSYWDLQTLIANNTQMDQGTLLIKSDFDIVKNKEEISEDYQTELKPTDNRKSFYGKAYVDNLDDGSQVLYSYDTPIIKKYPDGKLTRLYDDWSATTGRHIRAFCGLDKRGFFNLDYEEI